MSPRARRRPPPSGRFAALAFGGALLVLAAATLGFVWVRIGAREKPVPATAAPPAPLSEIPFDRPAVEAGVWFLELDAPWPWGADTLDRLAGRLRASRDFVADGRFLRLYPEAGSAEVRLRVVCARSPPRWAVRQLRAVVSGLEGLAVEVHGPGGTPIPLD